jgi:hypothetical protein
MEGREPSFRRDKEPAYFVVGHAAGQILIITPLEPALWNLTREIQTLRAGVLLVMLVQFGTGRVLSTR